MKAPRVDILVFPGTNSEEETFDACRDAGLAPRLVLWTEPAAELRGADAYILPGGFAYEDRIRAGAIAAKSPSVAVVVEQAQRGKLVLGLCNGAQVLAECGILGPLALAHNRPAGHFQCRYVDVELSANPERCAFTAGLPADACLRMVMAHGEGRFLGAQQEFAALERSGRVTFRYVGGAPNGALDDAAAICNEAGNVLACMPHPERTAWNFNVAFQSREARQRDPMAPAGSHALFTCMARSLKAA